MLSERDRSSFDKLPMIERRAFLGGLFGLAATAGLALPTGVCAEDARERHLAWHVFSNGDDHFSFWAQDYDFKVGDIVCKDDQAFVCVGKNCTLPAMSEARFAS